MLQITITVQFGINCTATSSNSGLIALLRVVIIIHYNACYVIKKGNMRTRQCKLFVIWPPFCQGLHIYNLKGIQMTNNCHIYALFLIF